MLPNDLSRTNNYLPDNVMTNETCKGTSYKVGLEVATPMPSSQVSLMTCDDIRDTVKSYEEKGYKLYTTLINNLCIAALCGVTCAATCTQVQNS